MKLALDRISLEAPSGNVLVLLGPERQRKDHHSQVDLDHAVAR